MASLSTSGFHGGVFPMFMQGIILVVLLVLAVIYLISSSLVQRRLVDSKGNKIPHGPVGLPIIGTPFQAFS